MSDDRNLELKEHEKEEILEEIDELVATNRLPVSEEMEKLKPQKSGVSFPLLINLLAVAAVLSTFYFSNRLFQQKQEILSTENATYQSAEGRLLEELKRESAAKLQQKEQEINSIQGELAELDRQSRELAATMDQQIADREAELRRALDAELEEERKKLQSQGKSEADIEQELKQIEAERSAEYESELSSFKAQSEQELAQKEQELEKARQLNQEMLADANSEIDRIKTETSKRESELTAQYEAEKAALAEEAAQAEQKLQQLSANQARESLVIDQINGSYETIFSLLAENKTDEALAQIESLRQLINDPGIAGLKAVTERAANDREMLDVLRQRIEEISYKEDVDTASLTAAADLLLSTREIAALGSEAYTAGNIEAAEEYYKRALGKIPALNRAWTDLEQIKAARETSSIASLLQKGDELRDGGDPAAAAEQYAEAAKSAATYNPQLLARAVDGLKNTEEELKNSAEAEKNAEIARLESERDAEIKRLNSEIAENSTQYENNISRLNADWEAKTADIRNEYEAKISAAEDQYNSRIADIEADYESKLNNAGSSLSSLEGEKNDEIDRLTRLIGERDQENLRLNSEMQKAADEFAQAKTELNDQIAELNTEIENLKAGYESGNEEQKLAADQEIDELNSEIESLKTELADLQSKYDTQQGNLSSRLRSSEITGYNNGLKQGRTGALEDILLFTSYLEGTATSESDAENTIKQLAATEPVYSEAVERISSLASEGSSRADAALPKETLIGSISYASGNSIIIEPLTDMEIESGTRITIKRVDRGKGESYVTFGIVTSADANKISARTDPAGTEAPRSMDLVYIAE